MSCSATVTERIAARCLLLGPFLRKVSTPACDWMVSGMQGGPVDELLDVAVERSALDQFEVEVGRALEDRVRPGPAGDHGEECQMVAVDQAGGHQRQVNYQTEVLATRLPGLNIITGDAAGGG